MSEQCDKCQFWELADVNDPTWGYCHRFPPRWIEDYIAAQLDDNDDCLKWSHPVTGTDEWCGEFKIRRDTPASTESIHQSGLSLRAKKVMHRMGIANTAELTNVTSADLLEKRNCGITTLNEIRNFLLKRGLWLRGEHPQDNPMSTPNSLRHNNTT